jgi:hypothetical protein
MNTAPLDLIHQPLLRGRLRAIEIPISEFSFPNLYLFRDTHQYEVIKDGDEIWIRGRSYDHHNYLMPTQDAREMDPDNLSRMAKTADYLYPIPDEWLTAFPEDRYNRSYDEGDSDWEEAAQEEEPAQLLFKALFPRGGPAHRRESSRRAIHTG